MIAHIMYVFFCTQFNQFIDLFNQLFAAIIRQVWSNKNRDLNAESCDS